MRVLLRIRPIRLTREMRLTFQIRVIPRIQPIRLIRRRMCHFGRSSDQWTCR
jgi:hypothetical protein